MVQMIFSEIGGLTFLLVCNFTYGTDRTVRFNVFKRYIMLPQ